MKELFLRLRYFHAFAQVYKYPLSAQAFLPQQQTLTTFMTLKESKALRLYPTHFGGDFDYCA